MGLRRSLSSFDRVVVLGGAGFIGSHLCDRLLRDGCAVVCLPELSTGDARAVGHLTDVSAFQLGHANVTDRVALAGTIDVLSPFASRVRRWAMAGSRVRDLPTRRGGSGT